MQHLDYATRLAALGAFLGLLLPTRAALAADIQVLATPALKPVFEQLAPGFERSTGHRLVFSWGASSGTAADALPARIARGEAVDMVAMVGQALNDLLRQGNLRVSARTDLATSRIGLAVRAAIARPNITTVEHLKHTLLAARSVAFSNGISGVYVAQTLFPALEIAEQLRSKSVLVEAPALVGHALQRGTADVGIQQMSELLAVPGIHIVGPLPDAVQRINIIALAVAEQAQQPQGAQAWIAYLKTSAAAQKLKSAGFDPL